MSYESDLLAQARTTIEQQKEIIERLTAPTYALATVLAVYPKTVVVDDGMKLMELECDKRISKNFPIGSMVRLNIVNGQIVDPSPLVRYGSTGTVTAVIDKRIQITTSDSMSGLITTDFSAVAVEVGDRVLLNHSNTVVMAKLPKQSRNAVPLELNVTWEDVGGLQNAKMALREALETPFQFPELFTAFQRKQCKGILLHGRPGNGKTLLGRAAATSLAKTHAKAGTNSGFIYVKGPEILSKWVGESEEAIRMFFHQAQKHYADHKYPAIIFFDEADALFPRRGMHTASGMQHTIVPQMISEMDGLLESHAIVILATNRADILDPALVRPERIDRRIYIEPPNCDTTPEIFQIHMRGLPLAEKDLIPRASTKCFQQEYPLYEIRPKLQQSVNIFTLSDLLSGAFISDIVKKASSNAIRRNIETKAKKVDGIRWADVDEAFELSSLMVSRPTMW
jgi:proteasome-associated ATPase